MAILLFSFAAAAPAAAGQPERATDLAAGLDRIARSHRVNLLFDERLVAGKRISVRATPSTIERELAQTLKGTGLTYRNAGGGTFVIIADTTGDKAPTPEAPPPPVPDILVIGRYTLDTDIRRSADDAQPYRTAGRRSIEDAQPGSVEEFLKTRLPQNAQTLSLNQAPFSAGGSPRSQIDLRGLGTDHTLVLVNGRRLPSTPGLGELLQPDVSGMPIQGIDRIETLASTAGGIFGIGADGGAVNIVTKNDFDEAALSVQTGLSGRGDAALRMIDAHIGWTSASKHTRVSLRYTDRTDEGLSFGSRDFIESSRTLRYQRVGSRNYLPVSASVNVVSATGSNLSLIPALGGQSLGASSTFLPLGPAAASSVGIAALLTNAGKLDLTLAQDGQGAEQSLLTPADAHSVLATVRQDVGRSLVVYADYLRFSTTGRAVIGGVQTTTSLSPGQLGNPFAQPIIITYPAAGLLGRILSRSTTDRLTIGAIAQLGKGWVANFDAASGQATVFQVESYTPVSGYAINAFAGGTALTSQLARVAVTPFFQNYATNRLRDLNLRVAGPLVNLPAGPLSITLTAELRDERAPGADYDNYVSTPALRSSTHYQSARQTVGSAFAEARIPIVSNDASTSVLRGLEAQVAVRTDRYEIAAPVIDAQLLQLGTFGNEVRSKGTVTAVTTSLRFNPTDGITLRGSYADGYTPPTQSQITPNGFSFGFFPYSDPKRPRDSFASSIQTLFLYGGQPGLRPQKTRTWSVGAIAKPAFLPGLRLSLDFTILRSNHEITDFSAAQFQYFVTNEALYPGRITRAPLSASDIVAGYTVGRITKVDASYLATGSTTLNALDFALQYDRRTSFGRLTAYAQATWEPKLRRGALNASSYDSVDSLNGPLSLRANGGVALSRGPWSFGLDAQAYSSYSVTYSFQPGSLLGGSYPIQNATNLLEQASAKIPAQAYVDAWTSLIAGGGDSTRRKPSITYRFGIKNLLDKMPPIVVPPLSASFDGIGYSPLGDPRGRRFELQITARY